MMNNLSKTFLILAIILTQIIEINTMISLTPARNQSIPNGTVTIQFISKNRIAQWDVSNYINVYNFPGMNLSYSINMNPLAIGSNNPSKVKIGPDLQSLVAIYNNVICWVKFNDTLNSTIYECDNTIIPATEKAISVSFLDNNLKVVIGKQIVNIYVIADLSKTEGLRKINETTLSGSFTIMTYFGAANKVIGILSNFQIYQMLLSPGPNQYVFTYTNLKINTSCQYFLGTIRNGQQLLLLVLNGPRIFKILSLNNTLFSHAVYLPTMLGLIQADGTILVSDANNEIIQFNKNNFNFIYVVYQTIRDPNMMMKPFYGTNGQVYIFAYKKPPNAPTQLIAYQITEGVCHINNPYCNSCNNPYSSICYDCGGSYSLNLSSSTCYMPNCFPTQLFNTTSLSCYCPNGKVLNVDICECQTGKFFNTSSQYCDFNCSIGFQLDSLNQCIPIICNDAHCILCSDSNTCLNCSISYNLVSFYCKAPVKDLYNCVVQNCSKCYESNSSKCIRCLTTSFILTNDGSCIYSSIQNTITVVKQTVVYPLSLPSFKSIIKSSSFLFFFLDQYWYYIYHEVQYRQQVKFIFNLIQQTNEESLIPQFIDWSQIQAAISPDLFMTSNYSIFTPYKVEQIDSQNIQFLRRTHDMYTYNFILSIIVFIGAKVIVKIITQGCTIHSPTLQSFFDFLYEFSLYKTLIVSLFETSIIFISFNCTLQLFQPGQFFIMDKISMMVSHIFFFIIIIYSLVFYPMVYAVEQKKQAEIYLNYSKFSLRGFINQSILAASRVLIYGFIHAYFINQYLFQISLLIGVKIVVSRFMINFRKEFKNQLIFLILLAYIILGMALDIIFILDYIKEVISFQEIGLLQAVILGALFGATCLLFIAILMSAILIFIKKNYFKNQIQPDQQNERIESISTQQNEGHRQNQQFENNENFQFNYSFRDGQKKYRRQIKTQAKYHFKNQSQDQDDSSKSSDQQDQKQKSQENSKLQNSQLITNARKDVKNNDQHKQKKAYQIFLNSNGKVQILAKNAEQLKIYKDQNQKIRYGFLNDNQKEQKTNFQNEIDQIKCMRQGIDNNRKRKMQCHTIRLRDQEQDKQKEQKNISYDDYEYKIKTTQNCTKKVVRKKLIKSQSYTKQKQMNFFNQKEEQKRSAFRKKPKGDLEQKYKRYFLDITFGKQNNKAGDQISQVRIN